MTDFLLLAFIFLLAGVLAVPMATRLGLGSVLGYLLAGVAISPALAFLDVDIVSIQHFAEFGVVIMLFLVGMELQPSKLWELKTRLFGLGGLQLLLTTGLVMSIAMAAGLSWSVALATGWVLSLSSTAIVLQTLNEKNLLRSDGGQASFSVLLFQDIAVIPILAVLPLLALPELVALTETAHEAHGHGGMSLVSGLNGWQTAMVNLGAIGLIIFGGSLISRPVLRYVAMPRLRELFTATALLIVIAVALLMNLVGLSPALGAFLGGMVLANSEYRHQIETDIDPFRGLLLGVFFITVGAGIDFQLLQQQPLLILGLTLGLITLKAAVLLALSFAFKVTGSDRWLFSLGLAQAGEFGFVLLSVTVSQAVLPTDLAAQLSLIVALSMLVTPVLFILYERMSAAQEKQANDDPLTNITHREKVIIAGHGRFGGMINRMLRSAGYKTTVVDYSSEQLERLRKYGFDVYFGDATQDNLLQAAGIQDADVLVVAINDEKSITNIVKHVVKHYPHIHVLSRAVDRHHVYELWSHGCRDIIRETYDSSIRAGRSALVALGEDKLHAKRFAKEFEERDRTTMLATAELYDPSIPSHTNEAYVAKLRELLAQHETQLRGHMDEQKKIDSDSENS